MEIEIVYGKDGRSEPTKEQQSILDCKKQFISIQAGPGTGKTFTLCRKIEKLLEDQQLKPTEKILFCSYTNALTSNNLKSISINKKIDMSKVHAGTLDSVLSSFLVKLSSLKSEEKAILNLSDQVYKKKANLQSQLFKDKNWEIKILIKEFVRRYPYILIDEIQDIRELEKNELGQAIVSPKYKFLELIKNDAKPTQLIIVGDDNQYLSFHQNLQSPRFAIQDCQNSKEFLLTKSIRKEEFSGSLPGENLSIFHKKIGMSDAILKMKDTNSSVMVILNDLTNFKKYYSQEFNELLTLKSFVFAQQYQGSHVLPQVIINSIFWYQKVLEGTVSSSLESTLLPFRSELADDMNYSYFKMRYYTNLSSKTITFCQFLERLLKKCNKNSEKSQKLDIFYQAHKHLYSLKMHEFKTKIVVTTIDSSKGLETDEVYFFMNGDVRGQNYEFVAKTRHKQKLYIVTPE